MKICFAIPARLDSTRIPKKMLLDINGKPLIRHVFDEVSSWGFDTKVLTDSKDIYDQLPVENVLMTDNHENGTARIASVDWNSYDYVVNIQGDMIDIDFNVIDNLSKVIKQKQCWTFCTLGSNSEDVKVIHDLGNAKWFTRHPIGYGDRHIGIYAYTPEVLNQYKHAKDKYPKENLEQNRILGFEQIGVIKTQYNGIEINTKKDINSWKLQNK
jgi:3-deoxy-manno-octulosonate cytidylyltransferase (CMP-KDO synthetase)